MTESDLYDTAVSQFHVLRGRYPDATEEAYLGTMAHLFTTTKLLGGGLATILQQVPGSAGVPNRALATAFQPSSDFPSLVAYRAKISGSMSVAGSVSGRIRIRVGLSAVTTLELPGAVGFTFTLGLGIAVADAHAVDGYLCALVPAGSWVLIDTVTDAGAPVFSLPVNATVAGAQLEQLIG